MKNNQIKKKIIVLGAKSALFIINATTAFYKLAFAKRTILFVTNQKIRSLTFGPISQICILSFTALISHLFIQSISYHKIISEKSDEISRLSSTSTYFKEEFENANEKLKKVNEYLIILTGSNHNVKALKQDEGNIKSVDEKDLSTKDKRTLNEIKNTKQQFAEIDQIAKERIKALEKAILITGLNVRKTKIAKQKEPKEISLNNRKILSKNQGGPIEEDEALDRDLKLSKFTSNEDILESELEKNRFISEIDHLIALEKLVNAIPLSRPMKNYYVSSGFGYRVDPITGRKAAHRGLDFVGINHEKIISPSNGKVVLAGRYSNYGNAVVIDHGYGVTTRYGHLHAIKVKPGQLVKKGEIIALQGNTGRSTGQHLHYEVRYRNTPLNPKNFLEAGDNLNSSMGKNKTKYVDS